MTTTKLLRLCTITLAFALMACQAPTHPEPAETRASQTAAIIGGTTTTTTAWPGLANLFGCAGTLVGDTWVLTAAHCIPEESGQIIAPDAVVLVFGRDVTSSTAGEIAPVAEIVRHAQYDPQTNDFDIALLRLARPARRAGTRIITAAEWQRVGEAGRPVTVVGWGATSEGGSFSDVVKAVGLTLADRTACRESYAREGVSGITDRMVCAGVEEGGQGSCQGDSGGPLFVDLDGTPVQIGIVSWGIGCARPGLPTVYTRVPSYLDWIVEQTNGGVRPGSPPVGPRATPPNDVDDEKDEEATQARDGGASSDPRSTEQSNASAKDHSDDERAAATSMGCSLGVHRSAHGPSALLAMAAAVAACLRARTRQSARR